MNLGALGKPHPARPDSGNDQGASSWRMRRSRAAVLSMGSNLFLTVLKLTIGLQIGSIGVISEAVHSSVDLVASGLAFLAIRAAAKPADHDHAYGHGKYENLSGLAEGALILVAGVILAWEAVPRLLAGGRPPQVDLGLVAIGASCVVNLFVSAYLHRVAREEGSPALEADAQHLSSDVITGAGVLLGLGLVQLTHLALFDGLTALVVSLWILRIGYRIVAAALAHLVDESLPAEEVAEVELILQAFEKDLLDWHDLKTRRSGSHRYMDVHLVVPGDITAKEAHRIADAIERTLVERFPGANVMTHVDVADRLPDGQIVVSD